MVKCKDCEYKFKCNIKRLKELKSANLDRQDYAPIDIERVKQLFQKRLKINFFYISTFYLS